MLTTQEIGFSSHSKSHMHVLTQDSMMVRVIPSARGPWPDVRSQFYLEGCYRFPRWTRNL